MAGLQDYIYKSEGFLGIGRGVDKSNVIHTVIKMIKRQNKNL
jgi:hypothetical protein